MNAQLFLIPVFLGVEDDTDGFSLVLKKVVSSLKHFAVENERSARRFIKWLIPETDINSLHFYPFAKNSTPEEIQLIFDKLSEGISMGLMSEAGMPCIADPGNVIVKWCHRNNILVKPLSGPSSIFLALAASGKNGQNFRFRGYLSYDTQARKKEILSMEKEANHTTQIFMETPYRNEKLLCELLSILNENTELTIACNIHQKDEMIQTKTVRFWKAHPPSIHKKPCIFIL